MIRVASLFIYPLKGARGISLDAVELDSFGPRHDRRWMIVDSVGDLVTQREVSRLCLVQARNIDGGLELAAPGMPSLMVPQPAASSPLRSVRVWRDVVAAHDGGDAAADWCTRALGSESRLVFMPDTTVRRTDPQYDELGGRVSFADGYPLLVTGEASLADLNSRLGTPLLMNRFRPNLVVAGADPFAEDRWRRIDIAGIPFDLVKPCARCTVPTVDQATAERGVEPLRTLASFRKRGSAVMFGMNAVHRGIGSVRVGDPVTVEVEQR